MKEKMNRVCKKVYDGYQRVVATVGVDRLVHLFLCFAVTVMGAMALCRAFATLPVWVAALTSAVAVFAVGLRKERADAEYGGGFDRTDLLMDGIGCVAGFVVSVALV